MTDPLDDLMEVKMKMRKIMMRQAILKTRGEIVLIDPKIRIIGIREEEEKGKVQEDDVTPRQGIQKN